MKTHDSCREVVERYYEEQKKLAKKLLELISESMGLKPSYINEYLGEDHVQTFIANYYPSCPQPELAMGLRKHSDPGALTVLLQDTNSGLQVLKDGQWITVKPIEGAFIVNLGDHMEVIMYLKLNVTCFFEVLNMWLPHVKKKMFLLEPTHQQGSDKSVHKQGQRNTMILNRGD